MNYEIFKEVVEERFLDYMPDNFKDYKMQVYPMPKVNQTLDALVLIPQNDEKWNTSPIFYVNDMYEAYLCSEDLNQVLEAAAINMEKAFQSVPENSNPIDYNEAKDNIIMTLVNTEQNKEMLANMPHREFQDLSIIYRWVTEKRSDGISSARVNQSLAEQLGMDEAALYRAAVSNTKKLLPPVVKNMNTVIRELFMKEGMPAEMADKMIEEVPADKSMYVIGNESGINGAASMLYEDVLHKLAEQLETDLYIMPSSVHEVIAISVDMGDPNELAEMVTEINSGQVELEDRLSNQVYHYDKDLRKLTLATDTPNKRIDGILEESGLNYETKQSR